jgi:hypothetical protein
MNRSQASVVIISPLTNSKEDLDDFFSTNDGITSDEWQHNLSKRLRRISGYCGNTLAMCQGWRWTDSQIEEADAKTLSVLADDLLQKLVIYKTRYRTELADSSKAFRERLSSSERSLSVLRKGCRPQAPVVDNPATKNVEMGEASATGPPVDGHQPHVPTPQVSRSRQTLGSLPNMNGPTVAAITTNPTSSPGPQLGSIPNKIDRKVAEIRQFSKRLKTELGSAKDLLDNGLTPQIEVKLRQTVQRALHEILKCIKHDVARGQSFEWQSDEIEEETGEQCSWLAHYISLMLDEYEKETNKGPTQWIATLKAHCRILYEADPKRVSTGEIAAVIFKANLHKKDFDEISAKYGFTLNNMRPLELILHSGVSRTTKSAAAIWWFEHHCNAIANHGPEKTVSLTSDFLNKVFKVFLQWATEDGLWNEKKADIRIGHRFIAITDGLLASRNYEKLRKSKIGLGTQVNRLKNSIKKLENPVPDKTTKE